MREIKCDICGEKIYDEDDMSIIQLEYTDNNFHCDLEKTQRKIHFEICHSCSYEFNDFEMYKVTDVLFKLIKDAKKLKGDK